MSCLKKILKCVPKCKTSLTIQQSPPDAAFCRIFTGVIINKNKKILNSNYFFLSAFT